MPELSQRHDKVRKSNTLIRGRHQLSLVEQKIILYLISKIKPSDSDFKLYDFEVREFMRVCGLTNNGRSYREIKRVLKGLSDKSWEIKLPNGVWTILRWVEKPYIEENSGLVRIRLDRDLKPYLLELRGNFTEFELINCLAFSSKYSIHFYEYICSVHYHELESYTFTLSVSELREIMCSGDHYPLWGNFKQRVLDVTTSEINKYSNKKISYQEIKKGREVSGVIFTVTSKDSMETLFAHQYIEEILDDKTDTGKKNAGSKLDAALARHAKCISTCETDDPSNEFD